MTTRERITVECKDGQMTIIAQRFLSKEDFKWLKDNNYQYEIQKNNVIIAEEGIEIPLKNKMESMLKEKEKDRA